MSEIKTLSGVEIKSESEGRVLARFATYDEIDHHEDITEKGAFEDGAPIVVSSYNHTSWGGSLPVGKGVIRDGKEGAYADLQFFMHTQAGRDTFETVKELGDLQQWSYGFDVVEKGYAEVEEKSVRVLKKVKVHEVSPVLLGAGKSTRTLAIKGQVWNDEAIEELASAVASLLDEEKAAKKPPAKKPPQNDEEDNQDNEDEAGDESDDNPKKPGRRRGKKPSGSGKMRMSDQTEAVITDLKALADRAEEIVTLRKSQGKSDVSDALKQQFAELLKQADRIFDLLPQDEEGYLLTEEEDEDTKAARESEEARQIYLSLLSEEL